MAMATLGSEQHKIQFSVETETQSSKAARIGNLIVAGKNPVQTPAYLVQTLGGSIHGISPGLIEQLPIDLALFDLKNVTCLDQLEDPSKKFGLPDNVTTFLCSSCLRQV